MHAIKASLYILPIFILCLPSISAQTITWDGGGDNSSWIDPLNWDLNSIPQSIHDVVIANATQTIVLKQAHVAIRSLTITNSTLEILDSLTIDSNSDGIEMINASIDNKGFVTIDAGGDGLLVDGPSNFINDSILQVQHSGADAINNGGTFENKIDGQVMIDAAQSLGIRNTKLVTNRGIVRINQSLGLLNFADFNNMPTGHLELINSTGNSYACFNSGTINNEGILIINSATSGILIQGIGNSITNTGRMTIRNMDETGIQMNQGAFDNLNYLRIDDCEKMGIAISSGMMTNSDTMLIDSTKESGIRIGLSSTSAHVFTNESSGYLQLSNTTRTGSITSHAAIYLQKKGQFINEGEIQANTSKHGGIRLRLEAEFINRNGGSIHMMGMEDSAFTLDDDAMFSSDATSSAYFQGGVNRVMDLSLGTSFEALGTFECVP